MCFSGSIGSGKTSVSRLVASELGWKRASFGVFVRQLVSDAGGDPENRKQLQDLGQTRIELDTVMFCRDMLAHFEVRPEDPVLVDGVRHISVFDTLQKLFPERRVLLLHLDLENEIRDFRLLERGDDRHDIGRAISHPVEQDMVQLLPDRADAIINAGRPLAEVVSMVLAEISRLRLLGGTDPL